MGIWDKYKRTFTYPNELHNVEVIEGMFEVTGLPELDLDHYPQAALNNKMGILMRHIFKEPMLGQK